jgi:hypothetical protein
MKSRQLSVKFGILAAAALFGAVAALKPRPDRGPPSGNAPPGRLGLAKDLS